MWKICSKCKKHKALWDFHKGNSYFSCASACKICRNKEGRKYIKIPAVRKRMKKYYRDNRKYIINRESEYQRKPERKKWKHNWYLENADKQRKREKERRKGKGPFEIFKDKFTEEESARLAKDGINTEVRCKLCKKYFIPTYGELSRRLLALNAEDMKYGESSLYCSDECKALCPVYRSKGAIPSTSIREPIPQELRQEVLARNNGMCEMCGEIPSEDVHHEKPVATHPHLQLDKDNLWGLCKECHYKVAHQIEGCTLPELKKNSVNNCDL